MIKNKQVKGNLVFLLQYVKKQQNNFIQSFYSNVFIKYINKTDVQFVILMKTCYILIRII